MRKFGVLFLSLLIVFLFFAGFFLFIIPYNRANTTRYGLLILQQLETAINNKIDADIQQFGNNLQDYLVSEGKAVDATLQRRFLSFGVDSLDNMRQDTAALLHANASRHAPPMKTATGEARVWGRLDDIVDNRLYYSFHYKDKSVRLTVPISRLMGGVEQSFPGDFFSAFLFLKTDSSRTVTVYKSETIPIGLHIPTDTLLRNSQGAFYPGVADLNTGGQEYKLFYIPLTRGQLQFTLCGLKDGGQYMQALHEIPPQFVYPLAIALILLLIALPVIKFYKIGPTEPITVTDVVGVALSVLCGCMLVTVTIIQVVLLKDGNARMQIGLSKLSDQIDSSLRIELGRGFRQLQAIDQRRAATPDRWLKAGAPGPGQHWSLPNGKYDVSRPLVNYLDSLSRAGDSLAKLGITGDGIRPYLHFDRVDWTNWKGMQFVSGSVDTPARPVFIDVSTRKYFSDFINNTCYRIPGIDTSLVSVEPVLTWSDGSFRVILARRSACPDTYLTTLSTDLYSVNRTVLPSGFGFCVIDKNGLVQVHSEPSRNLVENFLRETDNAGQLQSAINGRQALYLDDAELYGKDYGLQMTPIKGMPYYLVVFYDKGYILPPNVRILVFSLFCCAAVLLFCLLLAFWYFRRRWAARPLLFYPMDYLQVLVPREGYEGVYRVGAWLLYGYTVLLVLVAVRNSYSTAFNLWILVLLVATPLLVVLVFWLLSRLMRFKGVISPRAGGYFRFYSLMLHSLVLSLGVLPAVLFTWHAQNQEILQSVKREQLLMAYGLQNRRPEMFRPLLAIDTTLPVDSLYARWRYRVGVYSIYGEQMEVSRGAKDHTVPAPQFILEEQYFRQAGRFGNINYDPQFIPVLHNQSADRHWWWSELQGKDTLPFEFVEDPDVHQSPRVGDDGRTAALAPPERVNILSKLPTRYPYLTVYRNSYPVDILRLLFFSGLILVLLLAIYGVILRIVKGLFLQRWVQARRIDLPEGAFHPPDQWGGDAKTSEEENEGFTESDIRKILSKWSEHNYNIEPSTTDYELLDAVEREVVAHSRQGQRLYAGIFSLITPEERYLLYHFACHGFLNYKNVQEIDDLLDLGVLVQSKGQLKFFDLSFRAYIRLNFQDAELKKTIGVRESGWQRFRIPFLLLLLATAALLFFTQQEAWQRVTSLLAALGSSLGLLSKLIADAKEVGGGEKKK